MEFVWSVRGRSGLTAELLEDVLVTVTKQTAVRSMTANTILAFLVTIVSLWLGMNQEIGAKVRNLGRGVINEDLRRERRERASS